MPPTSRTRATASSSTGTGTTSAAAESSARDGAQCFGQAPGGGRDGGGGIAAETQQQALARPGLRIETRQGAHNHAFGARGLLGRTIRQALAQIGDEMHALVRRLD